MENIQTKAGRSRPEKKRLAVGFAHTQSDILEAQRLRYRVFAGEMGANLPSRTPGVDHDIYDPYCEPRKTGEMAGRNGFRLGWHLAGFCRGYRAINSGGLF